MPPRHDASRARHWLQAGFVGLLALMALLPLMAQMAGFNSWRVGENRVQASMPSAPRDIAGMRAWPRGVDAAVNDRFGLRTQLVSLHDQALFRLFGAFALPQVLAGPGGRLFLSSDGTRSLIRHACGRDLSVETVPQLASQIETLLSRLQQRAPRADLLLAPSAPVLYPAELPPWLRSDCAAGTPIARQVLDYLTPERRDRAFFPTAQLVAPGLPGPAIPRRFLHWDGVGAERAISAWAEEVHHLRPQHEVPVAWHWRPSDLSGFFPGLRLGSMVLEPEAEVPGVEQCLGWPCFPDVADIAGILVDVRRFRATQPGAGRLLVLSDSFGAAAAPWLVRYYGEVWQFTLNHLDQLSPDQRQRFARALLEVYRPDQVLVVMMDVSMTLTLSRLLSLLE